eukprot:CAMPEP_0113623180 /NCGR_PEP_ID=MMETSP0017_2-20120614/11917_1 /TAXON_ID=2856 /ORGANISM="Cylindrotheca closterium" /LENGTH=332 /DNA_ID=CAMNT_0000533107 /DNA_START=62 /DNA_END=1057 /DNA_ORIENTATION=- /assembly_acc=CAM_ASM_000147
MLINVFLLGLLTSTTSMYCARGKGDTLDSLAPLQHSDSHTTISIKKTSSAASVDIDTLTPFHRYMMKVGKSESVDFPELPLIGTWLQYFEAYHNHMARFRGKSRVVFMEIGVQSGGKIPLMRKYFGPGLEYVGIDNNPTTKKFQSAEGDEFKVNIEIGDSGDPAFLREIKAKYPHVDIFLDDGGHFMHQQILALKEMLPHVQPEGVYMCEDISSSWNAGYGGVRNGFVGGNPMFLSKTMAGLIHQTMDWFMASGMQARGFLSLDDLPDDAFQGEHTQDSLWWKTIPSQVKHIHYYNSLVVYEKGLTHIPTKWESTGEYIPYKDSGVHEPVNW